MNRFEQYLADIEAERTSFWAALTKDAKPVSKEEAYSRMRAQAAANPVPAPPARDLADEQAVLRSLVAHTQSLKMRKMASDLGIPRRTFEAYLKAKPDSEKYQPLLNVNDADTLWAIVRSTFLYLRAALPPHLQQEQQLPQA